MKTWTKFILLATFCFSFGKAQGQFHTFSFGGLDSILLATNIGQFDKADSLLSQIDTTQFNKTSRAMADYLLVRGYFHMFNSGSLKSLQDYNRAGSIYLELQDNRHADLVEVLMVINTYIRTQFKESIRRSNELLSRLSENTQKEERALLHNILMAAYSGNDMVLDSSIKYTPLCLDFYKEHDDARRLTSIYGILVSRCSNLGQYEESLKYIDSAYHYAKRMKHEKQMAFLHVRRSRVHREMGNYDLALQYALAAREYFAEHPTEQGQLDWSYALEWEVHRQRGNYKRAFELIEEHVTRMSLKRQESIDEQINTLMVDFETDKKENQLKIQALELQNKEQLVRNQRLMGIGIVLSLMGIFSFLFWRNRQRQAVIRQQAELAYQEKILESTINAAEQERKRISQDLHDGIGQQLTGLKMAWQRLVDKTAIDDSNLSETKAISTVLQQTSEDVRTISHQLMPASLRKLGLIAAVEDTLEVILPAANITYGLDHIGLPDRLPEPIEIAHFRIIQELLQNIVKHADASHVEINIFYNGKVIVTTVEDNGKGFNCDEAMNSGNGLTNIRGRVSSLKGHLDVTSAIGEGTAFSMRIPYIRQSEQ